MTPEEEQLFKRLRASEGKTLAAKLQDLEKAGGSTVPPEKFDPENCKGCKESE